MGWINSRKWPSLITPFFTSSFSITFYLPKSPPPVNNYSHNFAELFEILNINPIFNKREVTVVFRTLVRIYHPNKYYDNIREFTREEREEKFKKYSMHMNIWKTQILYFDKTKLSMILFYLLFIVIVLST